MHVLHDDVVRLVVVAPVVDVDDVGVREVGGGLCLLAEARDEVWGRSRTLVEYLDRDGAAEDLVDGLVDVGHAAGADLLGHPVPAAEVPSRPR